MPLSSRVWSALAASSRTFAIPIALLPAGLQEAVASAYLCLRAIDDIEDHATLDARCKAALLRGVSRLLQTTFCPDEVSAVWGPHAAVLPAVTQRLGEWTTLASPVIAPRIWDATAAMADRMAQWVEASWRIETVADLDAYTFSVAGAVGVLLCDLCAWHDGGQADRGQAIAMGRGLQAVNIVRNRDDDLRRGVDFFPPGWTREAVSSYARAHLLPAQAYLRTLPPCAVQLMCTIPIALALATLDALASGAPKLSREAVGEIVAQVLSAQGAAGASHTARRLASR